MPQLIGPNEHHQFYGAGSGMPALAVDQSGNADFAAGARWISLASFTPSLPGTVVVGIEYRPGNAAGYIFARYDGTTLQGIRANGSGGLQLLLDNAVEQTLSLPTGSTLRVTIHWSVMDDPVGGEQRSEVRVWNDDTGEVIDGISWSHATVDTSGADCIFGAQVTAGTNALPDSSITHAAYLLRESSPTQTRRDRVGQPAAPTLTGQTVIEVPTPTSASTFGAQGRLAGPTHAIAAAAVHANRLLMVGPLVNLQWDSPAPATWGNLRPQEWWATAPDGVSQMPISWSFWRPVPRAVNEARCRLWVESTNSVLAEENDVTLRVWSFSRNPAVDDGTVLEATSVSVVIDDVNHALGSGGTWVDLGDLRISRDPSRDYSLFAVSIEVTGTSAATQDVALHAVLIDPLDNPSTDADASLGFG